VGEAYTIWVKEHKVKTIHQRAKLASYLQRVARQLSDAQQEQLKQELFMLMDAPDLSPDVKLHFVVPALLDITDIPVSVRKGLLELELEVRTSTNVFVQRDFYEVMARTLQSSEYWEKYRNSVREVDSASTLYAVVYSNILRSINQEALAEHQKATYGEQLIQRGTFLLWAAVLCTAGLLVGLLWVLRMRRKALVSLDGLRDSQEQLRETEVRYAILRDQIQGLANQRSASIRKTALQEVLGLHSDSEAAEREQLNQWMDRFGLTRTEAEVLARIAVGWTNAELVAELNLAKSYIHNVRGQLRKKLNVPKNLTIEEFAQDLLRA
jgi:DNA-binding CsgD family transcriptional regulator